MAFVRRTISTFRFGQANWSYSFRQRDPFIESENSNVVVEIQVAKIAYKSSHNESRFGLGFLSTSIMLAEGGFDQKPHEPANEID